MKVERLRPVGPLEKQLFGDGSTNVFAVLDGASVPNLLQLLHDFDPERECLYRGDLQSDIAEVAPYLIRLERGSEFAVRVLGRGWGKHWGIFALTESGLTDLRQHLRKFLIVHDSEGKPLYFRFYDPRVLRVYLPTCNTEELKTFFGPISSYALEDKNPASLLRFRLSGGQLLTDMQSVARKN